MIEKKISPALIALFVLAALGLLTATILYYTAGLFTSNNKVYNIMFRSSTAGLDIGAPVLLQGVKIGEVTDIVVGFNQQVDQFEVQVSHTIDRNKVKWPTGIPQANDAELLNSLIKKGIRAKLALHSLVTGKLVIQIDFYPETELVLAGLNNEIPSTDPASLQKLMDEISTLDIKKITANIEKITNGLDQIINDGQIQTIENQILSSLEDFRIIVNDLKKQIAPLSNNLNNTLILSQQLISKVNAKLDGISHSIEYAGNEVGDLSYLLRNDIIPLLNDLRKIISEAESMIKKGSPMRVELFNALRDISSASHALYEFADYLEQHPEVLLHGKK